MPIIAKNVADLSTKKVDSYSKKIVIENTDLLMLVSNGTVYNINAQDLLDYIKVHPDISNLYITKEELSQELYQKLDKTQKGTANGVASLDENGKVPSSQLDLTSKIDKTEKGAINGVATLNQNGKVPVGQLDLNSITTDIDNIEKIITDNKPIWEDKYTKNEVDNKFSNIPKATQNKDGLLSKEDKTNYDDANEKKHSHGNKSVLDKITQTMLDYLSSAYAHISDAVKHITPAERTLWNTVTNKVDKVSGKQLSTNDYTTAEKDKLDKIAAGAEINVQSDWDVTDTAADSYIKNKPTIPTVPGTIKNPYALKANGKTYDGSAAIDMGTMGVAYGGTGATTAANARTNLGLGSASTQGVANNLTTAAAGSVLDARQGKVLNDNKINKTEKGAANGIATLGSDGKVPSNQIGIDVSGIPNIIFATQEPTTIPNNTIVMVYEE